jgi:hypothetical protein
VLREPYESWLEKGTFFPRFAWTIVAAAATAVCVLGYAVHPHHPGAVWWVVAALALLSLWSVSEVIRLRIRHSRLVVDHAGSTRDSSSLSTGLAKNAEGAGPESIAGQRTEVMSGTSKDQLVSFDATTSTDSTESTHDSQVAEIDVTQSLDELEQEFSPRQEILRDERQRSIEAIAMSPSCTLIHRILRSAISERVLSGVWGLRVHVIDPSIYVFARLLPDQADAIRIVLERRDGQAISELTWTPSTRPAALMAEIADHLRRASLYPAASFDPTLLFREFSESLSIAWEVKTQFALLEDMSCAQQYVPAQWMIYDWGIGTWQSGLQPYCILSETLPQPDWRSHMSEKSWVDLASFDEAFETAQLLDAQGRLGGA